MKINLKFVSIDLHSLVHYNVRNMARHEMSDFCEIQLKEKNIQAVIRNLANSVHIVLTSLISHCF